MIKLLLPVRIFVNYVFPQVPLCGCNSNVITALLEAELNPIREAHDLSIWQLGVAHQYHLRIAHQLAR